MPNVNIKIEPALLKAIKVAAAQDGVTLKTWAIRAFELCAYEFPPFNNLPQMAAVRDGKKPKYSDDAVEPTIAGVSPTNSTNTTLTDGSVEWSIPALLPKGHNIKTCRVYRCAQCVALGKQY